MSVSLSLAAFPHCCTDLDVTWGNGRECPLVVHCWADLQSVHGFCCYDNIATNAKCQRVVVLALCLVTDIYKAQDRPTAMICVGVCLSVTLVIVSKQIEPVSVQWLPQSTPMYSVLDGVPDPFTEKEIYSKE